MAYIHEKHHRAWPPSFGLYYNSHGIERDVVFDESAFYDLGEDNEDVNKLFGLGYFFNHHTDSARFGWNFNLQTNRIRLYAYCYVNGERIIEKICEVLPHNKVRCIIYVYEGKYIFAVHDGYNEWYQLGEKEIPFTHNKKWSYRLGCFFGGNNTAPHDIKIKITKK